MCSCKAAAPELENRCTQFTDRRTAYVLLGIPPQLTQKRQAGEVHAGGEAAWLKREIQEGFSEEAVFKQDVSEWRVREDIR